MGLRFTRQVQHLLGCWRSGQCYQQLSLEERVEDLTACMQRMLECLENQIHLALTVAVDDRIGTDASCPGLQGLERHQPVRAQQLAERRRRQDGRFKLARQPDLRDCVGKSLAMGHSRSRSLVDWRWNMVASSSATTRSIPTILIVRPEGSGTACCRVAELRRGRRRRQAAACSFIKRRRSIAERPAEVEAATFGH